MKILSICLIAVLRQCQSFTIYKPAYHLHHLHSQQHQQQMTTMKSKSSEEIFEEQIVTLQKEKSGLLNKDTDAGADADANTKKGDQEEDVEQHLIRQKKLFDDMSTFFNSDEATPEEVKPLLSYIMNQVLVDMMTCHEDGVHRFNQRKGFNDDDSDDNENKKKIGKEFKILDVGCGVGALFPFYLEQANTLGIDLNIVGVDLSSKMIQYAKENSDKMLLLEKENGNGNQHSFDFVNGDFVQKLLGQGYIPDKSIIGFGDGVVNEETEVYRGQYDAVVINACFGNFYEPVSVLSAASQCLKNDGILAITHPLGAQFVKKLHTEDPLTVPHNLPSKEYFEQDMMVQSSQPLSVVNFIEEMNNDGGDKHIIYYASAKKVPQRTLQNTIHLRGPVDSGYGRGGKKLGIPTANLPCSLFADALQNVPTGVYFGWAVIEGDDNDDEKSGRNVVHKAVVNVGYSPTFDGEENKEKIVEAHLIVNDGDIEGDFYGETMRLSLHGFLRPEMKFENFPALIEAIMNDKANAKDALDLLFYKDLAEDSFLTRSQDSWIGSSGGDENASYEFRD